MMVMMVVVMVSVMVSVMVCRPCDRQQQDPTPNLQQLREKVELKDLVAQPWLIEAANKAIDAAQAALEEAAAAAAASSSGSSGGGSAMDAAAAAAAKRLGLPGDVTKRALAELKVHKGEMKVLWEVVLYALLPEDLLPVLVHFVMRRLDATHFAGSDKDADAKRIVDTHPDGNSFFMYLPRRQQAAASGSKAEAGNGAAAAGAANGGGASSAQAGAGEGDGEGEGAVQLTARGTAEAMAAEEKVRPPHTLQGIPQQLQHVTPCFSSVP